MRTFHGIRDLQAAVGSDLGHSNWHPVTQEQIDLFAKATGDLQWIHIDPEQARNGPFGTTIAHGYLTLSLVPILMSEVYAVEGLRMTVNYGANRLRFPAPVPAGASVRVKAHMASVVEAGGGFQVTLNAVVEIEGGGKPACVVDLVALMVP